MSQIPNELAPCGVFCGACPSYQKSCLGCASESKEQNRKSKWACKIRICCYTNKNLDFCVTCAAYPCKIYYKKLLDPHQGDPLFKYRHEIPEIFSQQYSPDYAIFLENQQKRWTCPNCEGTIKFYHYKCSKCGYEHII
ncbi:MAG: DUF3795 domain-containing protein [Anaerolineaceae bacterium]|nr:DUF3795 domain-containing protein [Anaerolineaceae bacterium]